VFAAPRHTQHNDIQQNDTRHRGLISDTQPFCWMLLCWVSRFIYCYAECHYAECRYTECRGAVFALDKFFTGQQVSSGWGANLGSFCFFIYYLSLYHWATAASRSAWCMWVGSEPTRVEHRVLTIQIIQSGLKEHASDKHYSLFF